MVDWEQATGCKRSSYDMESERRPYKPQKASEHSTGFTSQIAGLATDGIIEKAVNDRMKMEEQNIKDAHAPQAKEAKDAEAPVKDDEDAKADIDDLEVLRAKRRQAMKEAQAKRQQYQALGHGEYTHITEDQFLKTVTDSERCVVHFHHREFERCKIMDMHLGKAAKKFFGTKFAHMDAEKAPFFVEKLAIRTLPCVVIFVNGIAVGRQVGFDGLGGDEFTTAQLAWKIKEDGGIEEEFGPEDEI